MSGAHAHSPDHHEGADHGHGPVANNTLRFNNGGILGVMNAVANLAKGVTYDAAKETFGGSHGADHGADHGHGAHGADHGHAANHAPDAAHGADHGAAHGADHGHGTTSAVAAAAGHALDHATGHGHGHDDHDQDFVDRGINFLAHAGHYSAALPVLGKVLKFTKDKLFPVIHEVPTEDQAIGNQILHKLKRDRKEKKKGKEALDHHEFEGFFKALNVDNLKRTFKMFVDKDRFKKALKSESGREELKKEIANMFDLSGTVDRKEIEEVYKQFEKLLHIHAHRHHGNIDVDTDHANNPEIKGQYVAFIRVLYQANELLTQDALDKIYGTEEKEEDFEMNYEKIGDTLLKVNSKNLKPCLNRIQKDGIDDIEIKVGDLLDPANITAELKHNPDDLREQIQNLFNVKGTVNKEKLKERKQQMEKRLQKGAAVDPYTAIRDAILNLIETAFNNLDDATLAKLYPETAAEGSGFEWTDEKYKNFSSTVFVSINTKNRANALKKFDPDTLEASFPAVFPSIKAGSLNTDPGRKKLIEQTVALTGVTEPFDAAEITDRVTAMLKRLGDGTVEAAKFAEVKAVLDKIATLFTADVVKKLFESAEWTGAENFIDQFIDHEEVPDIEKQVRGYQSAAFRGAYVYLFDANELDRVINEGNDEEKDEAKQQMRAFAKQKIGNVTEDRRNTIIRAYRDQLSKVRGLTGTIGYTNLDTDVTAIENTLTKDRLDALFKKTKLKTKTAFTAQNFVSTFGDLDNEADVAAAVRGYRSSIFRGNFESIVDGTRLQDIIDSGTETERDFAKRQVLGFVSQADGVPPHSSVVNTLQEMRAALALMPKPTAPGPERDRYEAIERDLDAVERTLTSARITALFGVKKPEAKEVIAHGQLGKVIMGLDEDKKRSAFKRSVDLAQVTDLYEYLSNGSALQKAMDKDPRAVRASFMALFGFEDGALTQERLQKRSDVLVDRLGLKTATLSRTGDAIHQIAYLLRDAVDAFTKIPDIEKTFAALEDPAQNIGYHHLAAYIGGSVRSKADVGVFLRAYNDRALRAEFPSLYPVSKIAGLMGRGADRELVRNELINLLALKGRIDIGSLHGQVTAIGQQLENGTVEGTKHAQLIATLTEAVDAAEPYMTQLFDSRESVANVGDWGRGFDALNEEDEVVAFLRGYAKASRQFDTTFKELMNESAFDKAMTNDRTREALVRKLQVLLGLDLSVISLDIADVNTALDEQIAKLGSEASLPDANTKAQHQKIVQNLTKIKVVLSADKRLEKLMKGNDVQPEYDRLGSQIKQLDDAKLVSMIEKFNSGLFTSQMLYLRGLDQEASSGTLNFRMLEHRVDTIKNLLGIPATDELDPTQIPFLASLIKGRLAALTAYFTGRPSGASNLSLLLSMIGLIEKQANVELIKQLMGMERLNKQMLILLKRRFTTKGSVKWKEVQEALSPNVLTSLALIEANGGEAKFLFVDEKGNYVFGDGAYKTAPQTRNKTFAEAMDECRSMGVDMMTSTEYKAYLESNGYQSDNEKLWLRYDSQSLLGSWDVNTAPGSSTGQKKMRLQQMNDPAFKDPAVGFRRVVRVASI